MTKPEFRITFGKTVGVGEGKQKQEHINHDENPKKILEKYFVHISDVHGRSTHQEKRFPSPMGKTEDGETQQHWDQQQTGNVFKIDEPHQIRGIRTPAESQVLGGCGRAGKRG